MLEVRDDGWCAGIEGMMGWCAGSEVMMGWCARSEGIMKGGVLEVRG